MRVSLWPISMAIFSSAPQMTWAVMESIWAPARTIGLLVPGFVIKSPPVVPGRLSGCRARLLEHTTAAAKPLSYLFERRLPARKFLRHGEVASGHKTGYGLSAAFP